MSTRRWTKDTAEEYADLYYQAAQQAWEAADVAEFDAPGTEDELRREGNAAWKRAQNIEAALVAGYYR